ncbi:MAG: hypothetical protein ACXW2E_01615 [Nitrososphaeraceae archaeon]
MNPKHRRILIQDSIRPVLNMSPMNSNITLDVANGATSNNRSSVATTIDFDGALKNCRVNEVRLTGLRRVENLVISNDMTDSDDYGRNGMDTTSSVVLIDGTPTVRCTLTGGNITHWISPTMNNNDNDRIKNFPVWVSYAVDVSGLTTKTVLVESGGVYGIFNWTGPQSISVTNTPIIAYRIVGNYQAILYVYCAGEPYRFRGLIIGGLPYNGDGQYVDVCRPSVCITENQINQNPPEYIHPNVIYNAGITGVRYFDYENGNTVTNKVLTEAKGNRIVSTPTILHEGGATNYFINSDTPVTQDITLTAGTYTCWLNDTDGIGTVTLSGGSTGVATAATPLTFTANGSAITFTVVGSNNKRVQVETGSIRTSYITSVDTALSRTIDSIIHPTTIGLNFRQDRGIVRLKYKTKKSNSAGNKSLFGLSASDTNMIYDNGSGGIAITDGTNIATAAVGGWSINDTIVVAVCWDTRFKKMSIHVQKNEGSWVNSEDTIYDGIFPSTGNIQFGYNNTDPIEIQTLRIYTTNKSFINMQRWIKST